MEENVWSRKNCYSFADREFVLLRIGNINLSAERILNGYYGGRATHSLSAAINILTKKLVPIKIEGANIQNIRVSYIEHYRDVLGEEWSEDDFSNRLNSLSYLTYKYARDKQSGEVIVVGFFGALVASGAGGKYLTNAELYVHPAFRGLGIATELVNQTFGLALEDGIAAFDSITYEVNGHFPAKFWSDIGIGVTDLKHIAGDMGQAVELIAAKTAPKSAHR